MGADFEDDIYSTLDVQSAQRVTWYNAMSFFIDRFCNLSEALSRVRLKPPILKTEVNFFS